MSGEKGFYQDDAVAKSDERSGLNRRIQIIESGNVIESGNAEPQKLRFTNFCNSPTKPFLKASTQITNTTPITT